MDSRIDSKHHIYEEIRKTIGIVPGFFKTIPERTLREQWNLFKDTFLSDEGVFEPKMKELIGLAAAAGMDCDYCIPMHTAFCKFHNGTEEELNETAQLVRSVGQWSRLLYALNYDKELFQNELSEILSYLREQGR